MTGKLDVIFWVQPISLINTAVTGANCGIPIGTNEIGTTKHISMSLQNLVSNYARYNLWANEKIADWLKTLERDMLYKEVLSSFGSIDLTLQHMHHAQRHWLNIITAGSIVKPEEMIRVNAADAVIKDVLSGAQLMVDTFTAYNQDELLDKIYGGNMLQSRYEFIIHVVNHNTYHRGQIVTIGRGLGVVNNIPETDYDAFLWYMQ